MRSNYKKLRKYIQPVIIRNTELKVDTLLGVSIQKILMPSIANTVGTNMKTYKIIKRNQFAYGPVTSRNGDKISVALLQDYDEAIVSQAYTVFEVKDENELHPEYLMMWMRRPEFDRYARFKSHGSAREIFDWDEMCETELPIPSIEKQREIVKEYNTIVNRIKLNEQLNQKLEETAQALYKHWFVDFEFPNEEGRPYKSSGGNMVYNDELDKEVPKGWELNSIQELIDREIIFKNQDGNHGELHPKSSDYVDSGVPFIMANDLEFGAINFETCKYITQFQSDKLRIKPSTPGDILLTHKATMGRVAIVPKIFEYIVLTPQVSYYRVKNCELITKEFLYCLFNSTAFQMQLLGESEQSTRNFLSITNQRVLKVLLPESNVLRLFSANVYGILNHKNEVYTEFKLLKEMRSLLLAKMTKVVIKKELAH